MSPNIMSFCIMIVISGVCWESAVTNPVVIKGSSPLGDTLVAIASSDPETEKYLSLNIPPQDSRNFETINVSPDKLYAHGISVAGPGHAAAGNGRSFVSTSSYNPFTLPLFNLPINLEGLGLSNIGFSNWFRSLENMYDPSFGGNGDVQTLTAVNDNGHVYGKVNSITFDNRAKVRQRD